MIFRTPFKCLMLCFFLFAALSGAWAVLRPEVRDDPYEFYYSTRGFSGTITVQRNPGSAPETLSMDSARLWTKFPMPPDGIYEDRLIVSFGFADTNVEVRAYLRWDKGTWQVSMVEGDPQSTYIGVGHDRDEHDYTQFGFARVNDYTLDIDHDEVGEIANISLDMGTETLGYFGDWIKADVYRVLDFSGIAQFRTEFYVIPDIGRSQYSALEARYLDTTGYTGRITPALTTQVFADPETYLPSLVKELLQGVEDDFLAIKILHDWVTKNIYYDLDCYQGGRNTCPTDPYGTVLNHKSVCEGFAKLMEQLGRYAHLPIMSIGGYVKGGGFYTEGQLTRHAYNIVYVNGQWYIVDATHDTGNSWQAGVFKDGRQSNNKLFLPMEYTWWYYHPYRPQYQFRDPLISYDQYRDLNQNGMNVSFIYELGSAGELTIVHPIPLKVQPDQQAYVLVVSAPAHTKFSFTYSSDAGLKASEAVFSSYDGQNYHFAIAPNQVEPYRMFLHYRSPGMSAYATFAALYIEPKKLFIAPFPATFWDWTDRGGYIVGDLVSSLSSTRDFDLHIILPDALTATLLEADSRTRWSLVKDGDRFTVHIPRGDLENLTGKVLRLYVTYADINYGKALLQWPIIR